MSRAGGSYVYVFMAEQREKDAPAHLNLILEKRGTIEGFKAVEWLRQAHVFKKNYEVRV